MKLAIIVCTICYVACTYAQSNACSNELGNFMQCMTDKMQEKKQAKKAVKLEAMKLCFTSNECQPPLEEELFCTPETCPEGGRGGRRPGPFGGRGKGRGLNEEQKTCLKKVFMDAVRNKLEQCTGELPNWMFDVSTIEKVKPTGEKKRINRDVIASALEACPAAESCIMDLKDRRRGGKTPDDDEDLSENREVEKCNAFQDCMDESFLTCKEEVVSAQTKICDCIDNDDDDEDNDDDDEDDDENDGSNRRGGRRGRGGRGKGPGGKGRGFFNFGRRGNNNVGRPKTDFNQEFFKCIAPTPESVTDARRVKRDMGRGGMKMGHAKAFCKCLA